MAQKHHFFEADRNGFETGCILKPSETSRLLHFEWTEACPRPFMVMEIEIPTFDSEISLSGKIVGIVPIVIQFLVEARTSAGHTAFVYFGQPAMFKVTALKSPHRWCVAKCIRKI